MKDQMSHLRIMSVGIVAANKPDNSRFIEVYPIEAIPFLEGEITDRIDPLAVTAETPSGQQYTVNLQRSMTVKAEWHGETHRRTSPNVRKGEQVKLWTTGRSERYYWEPMGRDDKLRRTETVTWAFVASKQPDDVDIEIDDSNTYTFTIDTAGQHVTLRTSKDNGEYARYTIQINTKDGNITAMDDEGNIIQLDSKNTKILMLNKDGTFLTLDKENLVGYAPRNVDLSANADVKVRAGRDMQFTVGRNYTETVRRNKTITVAEGSYTVNVPQGNYQLTTPKFIINGDVIVNGAFAGTGTGQFAGVISAAAGSFAGGPYT